MSLAIRGNDFGKRPKIDKKIDTFGHVDIRDMAILLGRIYL